MATFKSYWCFHSSLTYWHVLECDQDLSYSAVQHIIFLTRLVELFIAKWIKAYIDGIHSSSSILTFSLHGIICEYADNDCPLYNWSDEDNFYYCMESIVQYHHQSTDVHCLLVCFFCFSVSAHVNKPACMDGYANVVRVTSKLTWMWTQLVIVAFPGCLFLCLLAVRLRHGFNMMHV